MREEELWMERQRETQEERREWWKEYEERQGRRKIQKEGRRREAVKTKGGVNNREGEEKRQEEIQVSVFFTSSWTNWIFSLFLFLSFLDWTLTSQRWQRRRSAASEHVQTQPCSDWTVRPRTFQLLRQQRWQKSRSSCPPGWGEKEWKIEEKERRQQEKITY